MNIKQIFVTLVMVSFSFSSAAAPPEDRQDPRVTALEQLADATISASTSARADLLRTKYESLFPAAGDPSELSEAELTARFSAVNLVSFYSGKVADTSPLLLLGRELERRQISTPEHRQNVLGALIKSRMFEEARHFQTAHPELKAETLPDIVSAPVLDLFAPTALVVGAVSVERRNVALGGPYRVLVVAHPLCPFSKAAAQDIAKHPAIGKVFATHATWLAPPDRDLYLETFREWNAANPAQPMLLTYRTSEWPSIENWNPPTFYFFQDGQLVTWFEGWPKDGNWPRLIEALELIGALPKESSVLAPTD